MNTHDDDISVASDASGHSSDDTHPSSNNSSSGGSGGNGPMPALHVPVSATKGTQYLRNQYLRTRAYAEEYYRNARFWGRMFYALQLSAVGINVMGAIATLVTGSEVAKYIGASAGVTAAALGTAATVLNPGSNGKNDETAGDAYMDIADDLELYDPKVTSDRRLAKLVREVNKRLKKLRYRYTEPDHPALEQSIRRVARRSATDETQSLLVPGASLMSLPLPPRGDDLV